MSNNPCKVPPIDICASGVVLPIGEFIKKYSEREGKYGCAVFFNLCGKKFRYRACFQGLLLDRMFEYIKDKVDRMEIRHLHRKLRLSEEKIKELEETYKVSYVVKPFLVEFHCPSYFDF